MPLWKQLLLTLYYHASRPVRACTDWQLRSNGLMPIAVLFYHRVADDDANPWTMSNAMFLRQMNWLRERFDFVSLDEAQRRIRRGFNPQPCVSVTFDDGYADNGRQALPWLIKNRIPCTYFVTAHNVLNQEPFAHDLAMGRRLPPNTLEELRAMAAAGVEIGCHTYTHADLGPVTDLQRLHYEIGQSKDDLQRAIGRTIRYFAFPFGLRENLNAAAFAVARDVGYAGVCSAYGGYNFPGDDAFHLQRIPADNTMIRLKNWTTRDPRRLGTKRFEYREAADEMQITSETHAVKDEACEPDASDRVEAVEQSY